MIFLVSLAVLVPLRESFRSLGSSGLSYVSKECNMLVLSRKKNESIVINNDITVVVGKHDEWFSRQLRLKNLFAGCIKIIAVNQGNHSFFKVQLTTPQTEKSISGLILIAG